MFNNIRIYIYIYILIGHENSCLLVLMSHKSENKIKLSMTRVLIKLHFQPAEGKPVYGLPNAVRLPGRENTICITKVKYFIN